MMNGVDYSQKLAATREQYQDDVTAQLTSTNAWEVYNAGTYVTSHLMDRGNEATHNLERDIFRFVTSKAS